MATAVMGQPRLARKERPRALLAAALLIGWGPLVLVGLLERLVTGRHEPIVADVSVHVRLLIAVPLFLVAELALAHQSGQSLARLTGERFISDGERSRFDRIMRTAERLRSASVVEPLLLAIALAIGIAMLVGWLHPLVRRETPSAIGPARIWYGAVGQPLFLFLFSRSLWRWAIWARTLVAVARMRLRLVPGHPDRRGGISFLRLPTLAFNVPFLLAVSSVLCADWGMQIATAGGSLWEFRAPLLVFVVIGELLAFAPLLAFMPRLFLAARAGIVEYGGLATDYVRRFHMRWMTPTAARDELLGSADLQALNDLGSAYREVIEKPSALVFGPRDLVTLLVVMALPTLPLLLSVLPLEALLNELIHLLLGAH